MNEEHIAQLFEGFEFDGEFYKVTHVHVVKDDKAWDVGNAKALISAIKSGFSPKLTRYLRSGKVRFCDFGELPY